MEFGKLSLDDVYNKFLEFVDLFNALLIGDNMKSLYTIDKDSIQKIEERCKNGISQIIKGDMYNFFEKIGACYELLSTKT